MEEESEGREGKGIWLDRIHLGKNQSLNESDATFLPDHVLEKDMESEDNEQRTTSTITSVHLKSAFWTFLMVTATLAGRRVLRNGFPYPFYLLMLVQLSSYVTVAVIVLVVTIASLSKRQHDERYTVSELLLRGSRVLSSSSFAAIGMLLGAQALHTYHNLTVLAMLPILTYVFDSLFFRIANACYLIPRDQEVSGWKIYRVVLVPILLLLLINEDYRLDLVALQQAVASFAFLSISKVFSRIGPKEKNGSPTWKSAMKWNLLAGIPPLVLAGLATSRYENVVAASHIAVSWSMLFRILVFVPGVVLHILYHSPMASSFPFISTTHVGGALEEGSAEATDASASTLQAGLGIFVFGALVDERNFLNWMQVVPITMIYVICVGPKHIGYYPPRALNFILRLLCKRTLPVRAEPWQFSISLICTTAIFTVLFGIQIIFWSNTVAYHHDLKSWFEGTNLTLDTTYRPPELRSFDIVIAHSAGDPLESIADLVNSFARLPHFYGTTRVKIYSQDPNFPMTEEAVVRLKGGFGGDVTVQTIRNIGGPTMAHLHHILFAYNLLSVHTLFLSTTSATSNKVPLMVDRLAKYYVIPDFPIPDANDKTGFLNLGELETCHCGTCFDSTGWEDSFHLVPSMWTAAHPGSKACDNVLLTYGNNFFASSARIRGLSKDVWQLLYDALINTDYDTAWSHAKEKIPIMLDGEQGKGRWAAGGIYGMPDMPVRPYLGFTIERLWGILLQCSTGEIAWRCPPMEIGTRRGGDKYDCGCID